MTTQRDAMMKAVEALENAIKEMAGVDDGLCIKHCVEQECAAAVHALRAALAEPDHKCNMYVQMNCVYSTHTDVGKPVCIDCGKSKDERILDAQKPPEPNSKEACLSAVQPMKSAEDWAAELRSVFRKEDKIPSQCYATLEAIIRDAQQNALASVRGSDNKPFSLSDKIADVISTSACLDNEKKNLIAAIDRHIDAVIASVRGGKS